MNRSRRQSIGPCRVGALGSGLGRALALVLTLMQGPASGDARAAELARPAGPAGGGAAASPAASRSLHFDVFLDERPIGYQRFDLAPTDDGFTLETRARFELTLLRIRALDYHHENRERWRGGCLDSIESSTRQNGKDYRVTGRAAADGFLVEGQEGRQRLAPCVNTFAYWDKRRLLSQSKLLNAQTGEYLAVETKPLGPGSVRLGEREIPVDRYRLEGEDLDITVAYTRDRSEWVALDSPLFAGQTLRYRRRAAELAAPPAADSQRSAAP